MSQGLSGGKNRTYTAVYFRMQGHITDVHDQMAYVNQVMADNPEYQLVATYCDVCPDKGTAPLTALMSLREDARSGLFQVLVAPSNAALSPDIIQELIQDGVTIHTDNASHHTANPWITALRELIYVR